MPYDEDFGGDVGLRDELEGLVAQDELSDDLTRLARALERIDRRLACLLAAVMIATATVLLAVVLATVWIIQSRP